MLKINQVGPETYVCNYCGVTYDIRNALLAKGNSYFCKMECVLAYDKEVS